MGIYVWGTGCGASELIETGLATERITAFVDSFPMGENFLGKPVLLPAQLPVNDCDLLIITARHAEAIGKRCRELGIPPEKCLFLKNNMVLNDRNTFCTGAKNLLGEDLLKKLLPGQHIVPTPAQLADSSLPDRDLRNDYVRLATLELLCRRLDGVPGAAVVRRNWVSIAAFLHGVSISFFRSEGFTCLTVLRDSPRKLVLQILSRRPTEIRQ